MGRKPSDNPRDKISPTKRGYAQVYIQKERPAPDTPSPLERIDAYQKEHRLSSRQEAILHAIDTAEKKG